MKCSIHAVNYNKLKQIKGAEKFNQKENNLKKEKSIPINEQAFDKKSSISYSSIHYSEPSYNYYDYNKENEEEKKCCEVCGHELNEYNSCYDCYHEIWD